jgi:thymidine kinase|uniref:thymidine kinase n=1 Tax=viral metagenome TaxID=1070528 RepID=A0A6C0J0B3_9ZZZZ
MPKLYFRYGTMNSSKTANLIMTAHNYKSLGKKVCIIKPCLDSRTEHVNSRALGDLEVDILVDEHTIINKLNPEISCVLVDEAQFLSERNIDNLRELTLTTPVICYGLRTDYKSKLFEGSKRLMEIADTIEEIKTVCVNCVEKKSIINAKYILKDNTKEIIFDGDESIDLGREEKYESMCWKCWNKHKITNYID